MGATVRKRLAGKLILSGLLGGICQTSLGGIANAQSDVTTLPQIDVVSSRVFVGRLGQGTGPSVPAAPTGGIATGITGTSTTVITAQDIARSPAQTLPDILSREPGIQVTNPFGGVNAARSVVDMRGFGASATSNTLILINGRRINDLDIAGVDLAAIPRESIERVEITRGNSGVVLYGDGAVGGVINIVTKSGVGSPTTGRVEGAFGSFKQMEINTSAAGSQGPWSAAVFSNAINSDGYRRNNFYRQLNGVGDLRHTTDQGTFYLNLSADGQYIGLPGARRVEPSVGLNELATDRRGARTPFDWADKHGQNATIGVTRMLAPGAELIVDGGVRSKQERGAFHGTFANVASSEPRQAVDTKLTTLSFTPRVKLNSSAGIVPWHAIGGVDYYYAKYDSGRLLSLGSAPIHNYDLAQSSIAAYLQHTVTVLRNTDVSGGYRWQRMQVRARDTFDVNAPGALNFDVQGIPLDRSEVNQAAHLGVEHRINEALAVFGRLARSFRVPNVDERVGMEEALSGTPTRFDLRTQKSHDWEVGARLRQGPLQIQSSYYDMRLTDEIHFRFGPNFVANNTNLDPTRRYGFETSAGLQVNDQVRLKGGFAYTRAVFREGVFAGNDVPLVSKWTGNVGLSWDIVQRALVFDGVVRYVGARRMDNDQANVQPLIPAHTVVDVRVGGEVDRFFWSFAVLNLFDLKYFDYSIASPFPYGFASQLNTYNAYPAPGRNFLLKAGVKLP